MGWTDERVELLKKLYIEGLSCSQIAKQLGGVTRNAVIGKLHRLGMSGPSADVARAPRQAPSAPRRLDKPVAPKPPPPRLVVTAPETPPSPVPKLPRIIPPDDAATPRVRAADIPIDQTHRGCLWPIGDPRDDDFGWCVEPRVAGHPRYCDTHRQAGLNPKQPKQPVHRLAIGMDKNVISRRVND